MVKQIIHTELPIALSTLWSRSIFPEHTYANHYITTGGVDSGWNLVEVYRSYGVATTVTFH